LKAWRTVPETRPGGAELTDIEMPSPGAGEILVRVRAAALNRGDLMLRGGRLDPRRSTGPQTLGIECAGEIEAIGPDVAGWTVGDAVMGRCGGGLAEFAIMSAGLAIPKPETLSWTAAATMHVLVIAHDALYTRARTRPDDTLMVSAASSGIGVASIQLGRLIGCRGIVASSTSMAKAERLRALGADEVVDVREPAWPQKVLDASGGAGADVISDSVGASLFAGHMECLAIEGRLVSIGRLAGTKAELDLDRLALRRISLIGVTNRTRTLAEQEDMVARFKLDILPALADGRVRPCIDKIIAFSDAEQGWAILSDQSQVGKLVASFQ
jgi:NADPH2:quinone reductase